MRAHPRSIYATTVLLIAFLCQRPAVGQTMLEYDFDSGDLLTYRLSVKGDGELSSSSTGGPMETVTPLHAEIEAELLVRPIESLEDGTFRIQARVAEFDYQTHLAHFGSVLRLSKRNRALIFAKNGHELAIARPPSAANPFEAAPMLGRLAGFLCDPIHMRVHPNGKATFESGARSIAAIRAFGGVAGFGSHPRFLSKPVRLKQEWTVEIPVTIPGVSATTVTAHMVLDSITRDKRDNRVANIKVRSTTSIRGTNQPLFGSGERFRIEELTQELTGTFVFAVDLGRTERQETEMAFSMTVQRLSAGRPVGNIRIRMDVVSLLERVPWRSSPRGAVMPPDLLTP